MLSTLSLEPLYISLLYYAIVMIIAELSRHFYNLIINYLHEHGHISEIIIWRQFGYELIATTQMCTCVYENALIIKYYGVMGFFLVVVSLLIVGSIVNRAAYVTPLASIEARYFRRISNGIFGIVFVAELIGGYLAYRCARQIWYFAMSGDHSAFYQRFDCRLGFKVPYVYAAVWEIVGCFLIRFIIGRASPNNRRYVSAITVAAFLSFALVYIGVPGLNPIVASSRLQNCDGLDTAWFLATYWLGPIVGWMAAAIMQHDRQLKSSFSKND